MEEQQKPKSWLKKVGGFNWGLASSVFMVVLVIVGMIIVPNSPPVIGIVFLPLLFGVLWCGLVQVVCFIFYPPSRQLKHTVYLAATLVLLFLFIILLPRDLYGKELALRRGYACKSNLNQIGKAIKMYEATYEDGYPTNMKILAELCPELVNEQTLHCPKKFRSRKKFDYFFYIPADPNYKGPLAFDLPDNHPNGFAYLLSNGSVQWCKQRDIENFMNAPKNQEFLQAYNKHLLNPQEYKKKTLGFEDKPSQ